MILFLSTILLIIWIIQGTDFLIGWLFKIPSLDPKSAPAFTPPSFPRISMIAAARNEALNVRRAVESMTLQDYPDFEVIIVEDRSTDQTFEELKAVANQDRLKIIQIKDLPAGWLGKNYALYQGYLASRGEWILFTDADVWFDPKTLRCAAATVDENKRDHLVLFPEFVTGTLVEAVFSSYFVFAFMRRFRLWACSNPRSRAYAGVGAFNFLRRDVYETIGTHKKLALEVIDDMGLGRLVKENHFSQMAMFGHGLVRVRWFTGWRGVLASLQKNAFAGMDYQVSKLLFVTLASFLVEIVPFVLIFLARGPAFPISLATLAIIFLCYSVGQKYNRNSLLAFPFHGFAALLFLVLVWRSSISALAAGGIRWRDTFYSLKQLKGNS